MSTKTKKKIGTVLDEELFTALKVHAATHNKPISQVIEEALNQYLSLDKNIAQDSFGIMDIDREVLEEILEEDYYDQ